MPCGAIPWDTSWPERKDQWAACVPARTRRPRAPSNAPKHRKWETGLPAIVASGRRPFALFSYPPRQLDSPFWGAVSCSSRLSWCQACYHDHVLALLTWRPCTYNLASGLICLPVAEAWTTLPSASRAQIHSRRLLTAHRAATISPHAQTAP